MKQLTFEISYENKAKHGLLKADEIWTIEVSEEITINDLFITAAASNIFSVLIIRQFFCTEQSRLASVVSFGSDMIPMLYFFDKDLIKAFPIFFGPHSITRASWNVYYNQS